MYDLIGDIHGYTEQLKALLDTLGYRYKSGTYRHPERKAIFVGDYIDRGPQIKETLQIVRSMTESGDAIALMGNHEYNAICFHLRESSGGHLRRHSIKNILQHYETLNQFQNNQRLYEDYLEWFKSLPLFFEHENFRVVHACWDHDSIHFLKENLTENKLNDELIYESVKFGTKLNRAVEVTLKGKEFILPKELRIKDNDGNLRSHFRIKWWEDPATTGYRELSVEATELLPSTPVANLPENVSFYKSGEIPVFFGHYGLKKEPELLRENICCVDFGVAKNGYLAAYRVKENQLLDASNFKFV